MRFSRSVLTILLFLLALTALAQAPQCAYCKKVIDDRYVTVDGKPYHETCYQDHIQPRCAFCKKPIEGTYNIVEDKKYHTYCYADHIIPKCDICMEPLFGKYYTDFWGNSFHENHSRELSECYTCGRLICAELTQGGYDLSDGRALCSICNETSVEGSFLLESALSYVRGVLAFNGIDDLPDDLPITLVDSKQLKQLSETYSDDLHGFTDMNIKTIDGRIVSRKSHIYILSHLPLLMFKAVLAHELMHVYLFENGLDLRSDVREGFCNLGSELVYKDSNSQYAKFRLANMMESKHPDYGIGYQKMSKLLEKRGWRYLLETLGEID